MPFVGTALVFVALAWAGIYGGVLIDAGWLTVGGKPRDVNCETYGFDRAQWFGERGEPGVFDGREQQAQALVACRTLEGKTRAQVKTMLGQRPVRLTSDNSTLYVYVGEVNDVVGPADETTMVVRFDQNLRVHDVAPSEG